MRVPRLGCWRRGGERGGWNGGGDGDGGCEIVAGGGGGKRKEGKEKIGMVCGVGEV